MGVNDKGLTERLKSGLSQKYGSQSRAEQPFDYEEASRLRAKMLGVLLRDARESAARTVEDCARLLRVDVNLFQAWEFGDAVPSLPQLELLAYYLDVPVSHFWGMETLAPQQRRATVQDEYLYLRHRMIGAMLRQAREEANKTLDALSAETHIPVDVLQRYELGEAEIPMHELSSLCSAVNKNVNYFLENSSQIGELLATRENWKHFNDLPEDLREFAANPLNIGFIEIALAFSQMPNDKLKRIAVSMLDITGY